MEKGSGKFGSSASKPIANLPYHSMVIHVPEKTTVGEGSFENKTRVTFGDKQGCYGRATATEKASAGEFQWKNGKSGTRSEYKESSTVRIGDKSGYTEVYNEKRFRNVVFNNSSGSKNVIDYDNGDRGKHCDCGSDSDDSGDGGKHGGYDYGYELRYGYDSDFDSDSD
ncbi:hypothetical protein LXL04_018045 [Taraxacum kok-saghyz]